MKLLSYLIDRRHIFILDDSSNTSNAFGHHGQGIYIYLVLLFTPGPTSDPLTFLRNAYYLTIDGLQLSNLHSHYCAIPI